ncbi:hypothetical protein EXN66_Car014113 [Channa argus]|uniref:Ig-like domain-containing protein n=1 Tax=Channa argus TaxID=215402 RepID=A0A6G1Q7D8_CHAAH|nr:hypothetical protein EXN66_Car014113 [Channa argus]
MFSRYPDNMKSPSVSLLLGVSVLPLFGLTDSGVFLNVSPNFQQFFREASVSLSCVEDGQTVDGWTVKRTKGEKTEECRAVGSGFGSINGSSCFISSLSPSDSTVYWCETSSGQKTEQININVPEGTGGDQVILEIPALPVIIGSDVTLRCKRKDNNRFRAVFFKNSVNIGNGSEGELPLSSVQQSDEGVYHCYIDEDKPTPQSRLRVRDKTPSPDLIVGAVLGSLVLLVLLLVGGLILWRKLTGSNPSSPPPDVTYADITSIQTGNRKEPSSDPDVVYSSVKAGT